VVAVADDRAARYRFDQPPGGPCSVVAVDEDAICGFAVSGPVRDVDAVDKGEILALCVDPGSWRRGIGRLLMLDARRRLAEQAFAQAVLWLLEGTRAGTSLLC
jgi:ribosomal protein S18 acetylase RimI-like enzyme